MKRKKSQILFNFLPNDTFDHAENGLIGQVTRIDDDDDAESPPISYILDRVRPRLSDWHDSPRFRPSGTTLVSPDDVEFDIFPKTFECNWCQTIASFDDDDLDTSGDYPTLHCPERTCDRRFDDSDQQQLVVVCECGNLEQLEPPSHCDDRGTKLIRNGPRLRDTQWMCHCGTLLGSAIDRLNPCTRCGVRRIKVHSSSMCFYPQIARFVNATGENVDLIRGNPNFRRERVVDYLMGGYSGASSATEEMDAQTRKALEMMDDEAAEAFKEAREDAEQNRAAEEEEKRDFVEDTFSDDQLIGLSEELFEYSSLDDDQVYKTTLDDLFEEARRRADLSAGTIGRYTDRRDELNFSEVSLIENFPITTAVYGYSRLTPVPQRNARLRSFGGNDPRRNNDHEIFVQTSSAEAIQVSLDPEAVIRWLVENGFIDDPPEQDAREWFVEVLTPHGDDPVYPFYRDVDPEARPISHAVLTLVHTLSHLWINTIDALSGYSKNSLVEYTLPRTLSFVVYKRSSTDFNLGSMFTLVEDRFLEVCDYLTDEAPECIYDPVCEREEDSACEGCLYISELSCDHANYTLSRSTVYGGSFQTDTGERNLDGFFDVSTS